MRLLTHFIYKLFDGRELVYIGRSINPQGRWRCMQRRTKNEGLSLVIYRGFTVLSKAQELERSLIRKLKPTLNERIASSPARLGKKNGERQKRVAAEIRRGVPLSSSHRRHLWETRSRLPQDNPFYGKHHSLKSRKKIAATTRRQFANPTKRKRHRLAVIAGIKRCQALGRPFGRPAKFK